MASDASREVTVDLSRHVHVVAVVSAAEAPPLAVGGGVTAAGGEPVGEQMAGPRPPCGTASVHRWKRNTDIVRCRTMTTTMKLVMMMMMIQRGCRHMFLDDDDGDDDADDTPPPSTTAAAAAATTTTTITDDDDGVNY